MVRLATAVAVGVTAIVVLPSTSGTANPVVPTQWIAKQYSELLGRTPTDREWSEWVDSFDCPRLHGGCARRHGPQPGAVTRLRGDAIPTTRRSTGRNASRR